MGVKREGRKKVPIETIEDPTKRGVTFSKRRQGLFKKAAELSILCSCQIAIVILRKDDNKMFGFGHPSATHVINRYMNGESNLQENSPFDQMLDNELHELTQASAQLKERIAAEKNRRQVFKEELKEQKYIRNWWLQPVEELNFDEAQQMLTKMEELEHKLNMNRGFSGGASSQYAAAGARDKGKAPMT